MHVATSSLSRLSDKLTISDKLNVIHQEILKHCADFSRIAVALYEKERDLLKTFVCSCQEENGLQHYQSRLSDSSSLVQILEDKQPRIVNDLSVFKSNGKKHSKLIDEFGYGSSYTHPIYNDGEFVGFIFINSQNRDAFTPLIVNLLAPFIYLIGLITIKELELIKVLLGSVCTALDISHHRDPETGAHLERMSRYCRLIATSLAESHGLDDEYIEYVYRFSPLHDVGKIAIPDRILLKQGKLTVEEFSEMKTHTVKGREIITRMLNNFGLHNLKHVNVLTNIVEYHHENMDGSGYPHQIKGEAIPLEARIVAVADVFDALTSDRPYKQAWSTDESFAEIARLSGKKFDPHCAYALLEQKEAVVEIQEQFRDDYFG